MRALLAASEIVTATCSTVASVGALSGPTAFGLTVITGGPGAASVAAALTV